MRNRFVQWHTFHAVVSHGSFSAAAEALDLSRALVSGHVKQLEQHYGIRLLNRTTRTLSLTDEGQALMQQLSPLLAQAQALELAMQQRSDEVVGLVRLQIPAVLDAEQLRQVLATYLQAHPKVELEVILGESLDNLVGRGIDLALHIGSVDDSSLVRRPLCDIHTMLVASPDYWTRAGVPTTVAELSQHRGIHYRHCLTGSRWDFIDEQGNPVLVKPRFVAHTDSEAMALSLARRGLGVTTALDFMCRDDLINGRLQAQLSQCTHPVSLSVIYPARQHKPPRTEALLQRLQQAFANPMIHR
ncbi:LysR family transcriptional regulator [Ferrimonas kyonanensis]|uniref:LysR family transcriptional regulator n=1 Tax=Ferrimonas kyonanensis TaxID=364763 RepID=UPI00041EBFE8|nr:LysR family transcriptional regulator [Ferrimonas kyonanensis]